MLEQLRADEPSRSRHQYFFCHDYLPISQASWGIHVALNTPAPAANTNAHLRLMRWVWLVAAMLILTGVWLHLSPFNALAMLDVHQRDMGPARLRMQHRISQHGDTTHVIAVDGHAQVRLCLAWVARSAHPA